MSKMEAKTLAKGFHLENHLFNQRRKIIAFKPDTSINDPFQVEFTSATILHYNQNTKLNYFLKYAPLKLHISSS